MNRWIVTFDSYPRCHGSLVNSPFAVRVAVAGVAAPTADDAKREARRHLRASTPPPHPSIPHGVEIQALVQPRAMILDAWPARAQPVVSFVVPVDFDGTPIPAERAKQLLNVARRGRGLGLAS